MTSGGAPHHYMVDVDVDDMAMEDECYLGKYGQHEECVDFDPIHDANAAAEAEMPDFASLRDEVSEKIELLDGQFVADLADRIRSFGRSLFSGDK
ncbi:hypothetical protein THAOC_21221 [Thalassiosira oceanica]|uniref:Uncharacterized protein n=1 Tax=Thalassiosira oceanica TaxID=159749 RepID=K0S1J0_THAOC|nr:hypothetical protein THAOC_21221 [Thalassiosira oceanica]|eukprot:EJK58639.1 hypothetical protein THAOC_21221 [Thalassiosira oceanica]